jgi:hypothetical protein
MTPCLSLPPPSRRRSPLSDYGPTYHMGAATQLTRTGHRSDMHAPTWNVLRFAVANDHRHRAPFRPTPRMRHLPLLRHQALGDREGLPESPTDHVRERWDPAGRASLGGFHFRNRPLPRPSTICAIFTCGRFAPQSPQKLSSSCLIQVSMPRNLLGAVAAADGCVRC